MKSILPALLLFLPFRHALSAPPAAIWTMDETSGSVAADSSGNNRHAELTSVVWAPAGGKVDGAALFNGLNSRGTFDMPAGAALSFAAWVRFDGNGNSGYPRLLDTGTFRAGVVRGAPGEPNRGVFVALERSDGTVDFRSAVGAVPDSAWVHLAVVVDTADPAQNPRVYVNGAPLTLTLTSPRFTGPMKPQPATAVLGNNAAGTRGFHGAMDDVHLYTHEATLAEIRERAGLPPPVGETSSADLLTARPALSRPLDFDGDGLPDLLERALGLDPAVAGDLLSLRDWTADPEGVDLRVPRASDSSRFRSRVEISRDLQSWNGEGVTQEAGIQPLGPAQVEVTARLPPPDPALFARIRASDLRQMEALTFESTRDLFAKMAIHWQSQVNAAGTRDVYGSVFAYEWVMRMVFPIAAWLSQPGRAAVLDAGNGTIDLGEALRKALVNGGDPAHPQRWPSPSNQWDQIVVEAPQVSIAAWLLQQAKQNGGPGAAVWDAITPAQRANLNAFLAAAGNPAYSYPNNWNLFLTLNHEPRKRMNLAGVAEFTFSQAAIDTTLARIQTMYRGDGWYADSATESVFDDYLPFVILPEQMMFFVLGGNIPQAATVIPGTNGRGRAEILADISKWLEFNILCFDARGGNPEYGRSSTYTFARLRPLVMAYVIDRLWNTPDKWNLGFNVLPDSIPPGMLRRLIRLHLNHYLANGIIDPVNFALLNGQTPESAPGVLEYYSHDGSRFWAMSTFAALFLLPNDDPLWSVPEEPLPSETAAFESWHEIPGFLLRSTPETGHLELFNARAHKSSGMSDEFLNKYTKFAYSSRFGYLTKAGGRLDQNVMVGNGYRPNPDSGSYFLPTGREAEQPGVLRSSHSQSGARVDSLLFFKEGSTLRVHRVTGAAGQRIRDGGYPLGHSDGETPPPPVTGPDWVYVESSVGAIMTRRILGFTSVGVDAGTGNHSRQAHWRLPFAELPAAGGSPAVVARFHHASAVRFDPEALAERVASVSVEAGVVTVEWGDGTRVSAEFE